MRTVHVCYMNVALQHYRQTWYTVESCQTPEFFHPPKKSLLILISAYMCSSVATTHLTHTLNWGDVTAGLLRCTLEPNFSAGFVHITMESRTRTWRRTGFGGITASSLWIGWMGSYKSASLVAGSHNCQWPQFNPKVNGGVMVVSATQIFSP